MPAIFFNNLRVGSEVLLKRWAVHAHEAISNPSLALDTRASVWITSTSDSFHLLYILAVGHSIVQRSAFLSFIPFFSINHDDGHDQCNDGQMTSICVSDTIFTIWTTFRSVNEHSLISLGI